MSVGRLLRASRERCGEDVRDVAQALCIRQIYLEAIEEGRYEDLPGATYAIGFVRSYADNLGLDSDEVVRRFKHETSAAREDNLLNFPSAISEGGTPGGAVLLIGVVMAGLAYGGWYVSTSNIQFFTDLIPPLPERLASLIPGDQPRTGSSATTDGGAGEQLSPSSATAATPGDGKSTTPDPAPTPVEAGSNEPQAEDSVAATSADQAPAQTGGATQAAGDSEMRNTMDTSTESVSDGSAVVQATAIAPDETAAVRGGPAASGNRTVDSADSADSTDSTDSAGTSQTGAQTGAQTAAPSVARQTASAATTGSPADPAATTDGAPEQSAGAASETPATNDARAADSDAADAADAAAAASEPRKPPPNRPDTWEFAGPRVDSTTAGVAAQAQPQEETAAAATNRAGSPPVGDQSADTAKAGDSDGQSAAAAAPTRDADAGGLREVAATVPGRIAVHAKMSSWIQIRDDIGNQLLLTRLLRAGDIYRVPNRPGLKLLTGNAGALEILVDGEVVPSIGPVGLVRRDVALDADRLQAGTAVAD